jgi:hypothetical protein
VIGSPDLLRPGYFEREPAAVFRRSARKLCIEPRYGFGCALAGQRELLRRGSRSPLQKGATEALITGVGARFGPSTDCSIRACWWCDQLKF